MLVMCFTEFSQKELTGSQILPLIAAKKDWTTKAQQNYNFTLLSFFTIVGMILGSAAGGKVIQFGRRRALIIGCLCAIIGALMMQVLYFFGIYITGSMFVQFGTGMMEVAQDRFIEEFVPTNLLGPCLAVVQVTGQISTLLGIVSVNWLPADEDT